MRKSKVRLVGLFHSMEAEQQKHSIKSENGTESEHGCIFKEDLETISGFYFFLKYHDSTYWDVKGNGFRF